MFQGLLRLVVVLFILGVIWYAFSHFMPGAPEFVTWFVGLVLVIVGAAVAYKFVAGLIGGSPGPDA